MKYLIHAIKQIVAMTPEQIKAVQTLGAIILEVIPEEGTPNGPMYAALMGKITLSQYEQIIAQLKKAGAITEHGHYFERGPKYDTVLKALQRLSK